MVRSNLIGGGRRAAPRALCIVAIAIAAIGSVLVPRAVGGNGAPVGFDPLGPEEIAAAVAAVGPARNAAASDRFEVLSVERHDDGEPPARGVRRADVSVYDYASDTLRQYVVDVRDGSIDATLSGRGTQPPLSRAEQARVVAITLADRDAMALLASAYRAATGVTLTDARGQLTMVPIVFRGDSIAGGASGRAPSACGVARCAQLLVSSADGLLVDRSPVVNLSKGEVVADDAFSGARP